MKHAPTPQRLVWTPETVRAFWDGIAQTRLTEHSFSLTCGRSLILAVEHMLSPSAKILDFGAGDGDLIRYLAQRGYRAAAFEPSAERAKRLAATLADCPGFLGTEKDETGDYDIVFMTEVIEHLLDDEIGPALDRLRRMIRKGGTLIVTTPNDEDLDLGMCYCPVSGTLFHRWQHVRSFTGKSLSNTLAAHGFEQIVTQWVEFTENLFIPYDPLWGGATPETPVPEYLRDIRANKYIHMGAANQLMYIGRAV